MGMGYRGMYESGKTPDKYICSKCNASGVRLYREYSTFNPALECTNCTEKSQNMKLDPKRIYDIGWRVIAVPDEEGAGYWGYGAVPKDGIKWWNNLPLTNG